MNYKGLLKGVHYWNRKLHIHIALFLLLFIWLFSFSGLLLNHHNWEISNFWEKREESIRLRAVHISNSRDSVEVIRNIISQLKVEGEITNVKRWPDSIHLTVSAPGHNTILQMNYKTGACVQKDVKVNWVGKLQALHKFNGVNKKNVEMQPNWIFTLVWRISMDAIAIGLILLCISSWIMWFKIRERYSWGLVALICGFIVAAYFVFILRAI